MARIRTIKPEFWEDEKIAQLTLPCRLFFIGCWNFADDFGVMKGNATLLKSWIFPYDEDLRVSEVRKWIDALVNAQMLVPISYQNESYYIIRTFRNHQVLDKRYEKSYLPKEFIISEISKQQGDNYDITTCSHSDHDVVTAAEMEKEKEYKENNTKESDDEFDRFWNMYDYKKGDKTKVKKKFLSLSRVDREKIFETLPLYVESTPDKQYRKHPQTYLNNRSWEDEILQRNTHQSAPMANLGVGEFINQQGQRTYGSGKYIIPMDAPPRPGQNYYFDASTQKWML